MYHFLCRYQRLTTNPKPHQGKVVEGLLRLCYSQNDMPTQARYHKQARPPGKEHRPKFPSEDQKTKARRIRATNKWRKMSEAKRQRNPLCEDPFGVHKSRPVMAESVHHIEPIETRPDLAYCWDNLMSVCNHCHNRLDKSKGINKTPQHTAPWKLPRSLQSPSRPPSS